MSEKKRYRKRADLTVTAVRLDLDTDGFTYRKWGGLQTCKAGDWLVNNQGETYTVDAQSFAASYREVSPGVYFKHGEVWAAVAEHDGVIPTKEGGTHYRAGDYLVYNQDQEEDAYAVSSEVFEAQYEPF